MRAGRSFPTFATLIRLVFFLTAHENRGHPLKAFQHPSGSKLNDILKRGDDAFAREQESARHWGLSSSITSPSFSSLSYSKDSAPSLLDRFALKHHGLFPDDLIAAPDCMVHGRRQRCASSSAAARHWVFSSVSPIASALECRSIIDEAEAFWSQYETDGILEKGKSGFTLTDHNCDVHVRDLQRTREWLVEDALPSRIQPFLDAAFPGALGDMQSLHIYDALVVKYDGSGETPAHQPMHSDFSLFSVNIALNDAVDYSGGGTYFEWTDQVVRLTTAGQAICHPSALRHAGKGVDAGVRYILVLFLNISPQTSLCQARRCKRRGIEARKRHVDASEDSRSALLEALEEYECGLTLNAYDHELWHYRGIVLWQLAKTTNALKSNSHGDTGAIIESAKERRFAAEESFKHALSLNKRDPRPANNLGVMALEAAEKNEETQEEAAINTSSSTLLLHSALTWFQKAASIDPTDAGAALNIGVALMRLHRDQEAVAHFRQATKSFPQDSRVREALGVAESLLTSL